MPIFIEFFVYFICFPSLSLLSLQLIPHVSKGSLASTFFFILIFVPVSSFTRFLHFSYFLNLKNFSQIVLGVLNSSFILTPDAHVV
jgi:hypothetical protein